MIATLFAQADLVRGAIYLLVVILVAWLIWYAVGQLFTLPEPARVVIGVILALFVLLAALRLFGLA